MNKYIDRMPSMTEYAEGKRIDPKYTDLISRADAIDAVAEEWLSEASAESPYVNDDDIGEYRKLAEKLFEDVPSADALLKQEIDFHKEVSRIEAEKVVDLEHKLADAVQGEWTHDGQNFKGGLDWCHCSVCGYKTSTNGISIYRYCPNCGARMNKGGAE